MDIERGNLEILFKKIPFEQIQLFRGTSRDCHTYDCVGKRLYLEYAKDIFPRYSEDERVNNYLLLNEDMKSSPNGLRSVFGMISKVASKLLIFQSQKIKCKLEEMLRWREISFQLGQDFFTCAFLAQEDLRRGRKNRFFAWEPIIGSNDMRLDNILKRGMAENHFHLNGSTKIFELNWICLMNHIENRGKEFKNFEKMLQYNYGSSPNRKGFYEMCLRAALYRIYLFAVIHHDNYLTESLQAVVDDVEKGIILIWEKVSDLQDIINLAREMYGAWNEKQVVLDYALEKDVYDENNNPSRLLSGERRFLYECYKRAFGTEEYSFKEYQKNVFYRYLVARTYFRSEMVQVNRMVGFSNFGNYESRKEYFVEGKKEYEYELVRLAVNASFQEQNIVSLEARICPASDSHTLAGKMNQKLECVCEDEIKEKMFFVLHFPKAKDEKYKLLAPRDVAVRRKTEKCANAIIALLEKKGRINQYIRGIDACANEIGCRPEVFAQIYRYLLDYLVPVELGGRGVLMATYHAGEDFLDLVDGLRAIDEAVLFCNLHRGCRIGHALALGIDPSAYYQFKGNVLALPKQDLLDNIVWLLVKQDEYGIGLNRKLRSILDRKFYDLFYEICPTYNLKNARCDSINYLEYYNSWQLRGDFPESYLLDEEAFECRLNSTPLKKISRYEFNAKVSNTVRKTHKYRELYRMYHYDEHVRKEGAKRVLFKIPCGYAEVVREIQNRMIQMLVMEGIGIETNPSSNYLIGTIQKYEEHPILRFNGRKLRNTENNMSLQVSLNTDDQGVFDTSLENEFALIAAALRKAKTEDGQYIYDVEDIYAWIDYVRRMGITQVFSATSGKMDFRSRMT